MARQHDKKLQFQERFVNPPVSSFPFAIIAHDRAVLRSSLLGFANQLEFELGSNGLGETVDMMDIQTSVKMLFLKAHKSFAFE